MPEIFLGLTILGNFLSFFFSISEVSLFSLSRIDWASLQSMGIKEKYLKIVKNPQQLLLTLLSGNELSDYFASFFFASLITSLYWEEFRGPLFIFYGLFSFWVGDYLAKLLGFKLRSQLVLKIFPWVYFFYQLFFPIRSFLYKIYQNFEKFIPEPNFNLKESLFTPVEQIILHSLELAYQEKMISLTEKEFIYGLFLSEKLSVSTVMTPRSEIVAFRDCPISLEFLRKIKDLPYNKFPIYRDTLDQVLGILYVKDLFRYLSSEIIGQKFLSEMVRPPYFIPENFKVRDLLLEFQRREHKIALVIDEYGVLKGLVTLEDILEELFGEILSEKEKPKVSLQLLKEGSYLLSGTLLLEELKETLGITIDEELEDLKTLNGLMLTLFKGVPKEGDKIIYSGWEFLVKKIKGRKILWVIAKKVEK